MTLAVRVTQWDDSRCDSANCGAATAAWLANCARPNATRETGAEMRKAAGYDCLGHPGAPGFFTQTLVDSLKSVGVTGRAVRGKGTMTMLKDRCANGEVAGILGLYLNLKPPFEVSRSFNGDHWVGVGDYRASDDSFAWADSLKQPGGTPPVRIPAAMVQAFWFSRTKGSKLPTGYAVFVRTPDFQEEWMIQEDLTRDRVIPIGTVYLDSPGGDPTKVTEFTGEPRTWGTTARAGWNAVRVKTGGGVRWLFLPASIGELQPKAAVEPLPPTGQFTQAQMDAAVLAQKAADDAAFTERFTGTVAGWSTAQDALNTARADALAKAGG